jgi:hypothetical protein
MEAGETDRMWRVEEGTRDGTVFKCIYLLRTKSISVLMTRFNPCIISEPEFLHHPGEIRMPLNSAAEQPQNQPCDQRLIVK